MNTKIRNKKIIQLRKKGLNLLQIGKKFKISSERVRQILIRPTLKYKRCLKHKSSYLEKCLYCSYENTYKQILSKINDTDLQQEINRLSRYDRKKETVIQRTFLIRKLRDKYNLSFNKIAYLLKRDRTSITNLYFKKV